MPHSTSELALFAAKFAGVYVARDMPVRAAAVFSVKFGFDYVMGHWGVSPANYSLAEKACHHFFIYQTRTFVQEAPGKFIGLMPRSNWEFFIKGISGPITGGLYWYFDSPTSGLLVEPLETRWEYVLIDSAFTYGINIYYLVNPLKNGLWNGITLDGYYTLLDAGITLKNSIDDTNSSLYRWKCVGGHLDYGHCLTNTIETAASKIKTEPTMELFLYAARTVSAFYTFAFFSMSMAQRINKHPIASAVVVGIATAGYGIYKNYWDSERDILGGKESPSHHELQF